MISFGNLYFGELGLKPILQVEICILVRVRSGAYRVHYKNMCLHQENSKLCRRQGFGEDLYPDSEENRRASRAGRAAAAAARARRGPPQGGLGKTKGSPP